jgi:hypothetical protein
MDAPADTLMYFIAGYAVIFFTILGYLASIALRNRNLKRDEAMLRELEDRGK